MKTVIHSPNIIGEGIKAFFTTRHFSGDNDIKEALASDLAITEDHIYLPIQRHTSHIHVLQTNNAPVVADAVITDTKEVVIGVIVADCVPVLLYDLHRKVIGAVHAGWKGTAGAILQNTISTMHEQFDSLPENILVSIGPSIKKCSYEVDAEVHEAVAQKTGQGSYSVNQGSKFMLDLAEANRIQATNSGVAEQNIWVSPDCTFCNPERYHSYRFAGEHAQRQGAFIGMW